MAAVASYKAAGFNQVPCTGRAKELLQILPSSGVYSWSIMLFGVQGGPGVFQRGMDIVLNDMLAERLAHVIGEASVSISMCIYIQIYMCAYIYLYTT